MDLFSYENNCSIFLFPFNYFLYQVYSDKLKIIEVGRRNAEACLMLGKYYQSKVDENSKEKEE